MSKSDQNQKATVFILDSEKDIVKKIKSAVTDNEAVIRYDRQHKPGISNLLDIFSICSGRSIAELEAAYRGKGYGALKTDVAEAVVRVLKPIRRRFDDIQQSPELDKILDEGARRAYAIARKTLKAAENALGIGRKNRP